MLNTVLVIYLHIHLSILCYSFILENIYSASHETYLRRYQSNYGDKDKFEELLYRTKRCNSSVAIESLKGVNSI